MLFAGIYCLLCYSRRFIIADILFSSITLPGKYILTQRQPCPEYNPNNSLPFLSPQFGIKLLCLLPCQIMSTLHQG